MRWPKGVIHDSERPELQHEIDREHAKLMAQQHTEFDKVKKSESNRAADHDPALGVATPRRRDVDRTVKDARSIGRISVTATPTLPSMMRKVMALSDVVRPACPRNHFRGL